MTQATLSEKERESLTDPEDPFPAS